MILVLPVLIVVGGLFLAGHWVWAIVALIIGTSAVDARRARRQHRYYDGRADDGYWHPQDYYDQYWLTGAGHPKCGPEIQFVEGSEREA